MTNERTTPRSLGRSPMLTPRPDPEPAVSFRFGEYLRVVSEHKVTIEKGDIIKEAGEVHPACYIVLDGEIEVYRDIYADDGQHTVVVEYARKGSILNEFGFFGDSMLGRTEAFRYVAATQVTFAMLMPELLREKLGPHFSLFALIVKQLSIKVGNALDTNSELYKTVYNHRITDKDLQVDALRTRAVTLEQQMPPLEAANDELMEQNVDLRSKVDHLEAETKRLKDEIEELKTANAKLKELKTARVAFMSLQEDERYSKAIVNLSNFYKKLMKEELTLEQMDEARSLTAELRPSWMRDSAMLETSLQDELRKALIAGMDGPTDSPTDGPIEKVVGNPQGAVTVRDIPRVRLQSPPASTVREGTHVPLQRTASQTTLAAVRSPEPLRLPPVTMTTKRGQGPLRSPTLIGTPPASQMPPTKPEGRRNTPLAVPALPPRPAIDRSPHTMRGMPAVPAKAPPSGDRGVIPALGSNPTPLGVKRVTAEAPLPETEDDEFATDRKTFEGIAPASEPPSEPPKDSAGRVGRPRRENTQRNQFDFSDLEIDLNSVEAPPTQRNPRQE